MAASQNRRSTGRKKTSSKTAYRKNSGNRAASTLLIKEVGIWIALACGIILELCNFGVGKEIGNVIAGVFFGICGLWNYVFPVFLVFSVVFLVLNRGKASGYVKFALLIVASFMVCTFIQLVSGPFDENVGYFDYYSISSKGKSGGGFIGGALTKLLCTSLGKPIAYVIVIIVFIICAVIISEKSFFKGIKDGGERAYEKARDNAEVRSEKQKIIKEERRARREEDRARELESLRERERIRNEKRALEEEMHRREGLSDPDRDDYADVKGYGSGKISDNTEHINYYSEDINSIKQTSTGRNKGRSNVSLTETELVISPCDPDSEMACLKEARDKASSIGSVFETVGSGSCEIKKATTNFIKGFESDNFEKIDKSKRDPVKVEKKDSESEKEEKYRLDLVWDNRDSGSAVDSSYVDNNASPDILKYANENINRANISQDDFIVNLSDEDYSDNSGYIDPGQFVVNRSAGNGNINQSDAGNYDIVETNVSGRRSGKTGSIRITTVSDDGESIEVVNNTPEKKKRSTKETRQETQNAMAEVEEEISSNETEVDRYEFPSVELLKPSKKSHGNGNSRSLQETADKLVDTLESFGVHTHIINVSCGPSVTRYELAPETGVKVSRIVNLADDIKLNLAASDIRIEAPIPGKAAVGIEVPNKDNTTVTLRELIETGDFINHKSKIAFAVGLDLGGRPVIADIFKMPHLLIGGATGSGKSVCINTLIISILYKARPDEVKFIMIDPKMIELNLYNGIPHLFIPVVTDPRKAAGALQWAVAEMTKRYTLFSALGVRDLKGYNSKILTAGTDPGGMPYKKLPQIVIVVDEFADLMMVASGEVEEAVCRLAQLARAAGIHLILATQRPSVDVITGLIKANMPSRLALAVSSGVDSRTIIDMVGAEKLLGKGDMLFYPSGLPKPIRVQGAYVTEQEVERVVEFVKSQNGDAAYDENVANQIEEHVKSREVKKQIPDAVISEDDDGRDAYFKDAARYIVDKDKASIGSLQRVFKIGFNRAARIMDQLCEAGIVGEEEGTKPRKILMNMSQLEEFLNTGEIMEPVVEESEGEQECTV